MNRIDNVIDRILSLFNSHWYYNYNVKFNGAKWKAPIDNYDHYNSKIHFKGDFSNLLNIAINTIKDFGDYRSMRINPNISEIDYRWYWYYPYTINGAPVHKYFHAQIRPFSMVIRFKEKNPDYNYITYNCMHKTAELLGLGRFSINNEYHQKVLGLFSQFSIPNLAYYTLQIFNHASNHNQAAACYAGILLYRFTINMGNIPALRNYLSSTIGLF